MGETEIRTYAELFNNALTLFEWAVNQVKEGRIIAALDESTMKYKELAMPPLEIVAKKALVGASSTADRP
jgi:hypothetical protein